MDSKKFLFAMAACFVIIIGFRFLDRAIYGPPEETQKSPAQTTEAPQGTPDTESTDQEARQTQTKTSQTTPPPQLIQAEGYTLVVKDADLLQEKTVSLGSRERGSDFKIQAELTTDAASITQAWLTEFIPNSNDYKYAQSPYHRDEDPVTLLAPVAGRFKAEGDNQDLPQCKNSLATSRLQFIGPKSQNGEPGRKLLAKIDAFPWKLAGSGENWARFETTLQLLHSQNEQPLAELTLKKTYTLARDSYDLQVKIELTLSENSADYTVELIQDGPTGMALESARGDVRGGIFGVMAAKGVQVNTFLRTKLDKKPGDIGVSDPSEGDLLWAGVMNKFFAALLVPESSFANPENPDAPNPADIFKRVRILPIVDPETGKSGNVLARLVAPSIQLQPGRTKTISMSLFLGPKDRQLLKSGQYGLLKFNKSVQPRTCCAWMTFAPLSEGLLWVMGKIYWLIPNYGVAIILLVALVRLALHHFTKTSQMSMMRMSKLGPEMEKLKKKYANTREELGRAQMALYKTHKVNPISGCLPMALQMPVWIALYSALSTAVELRHARFFFWINNLSGPDNITAYFAGGLAEEPFFTLPLLGAVWGLNLLPILLGVGFFLQQKFNPSASGAASAQAEQTRKMMYFMMAIFPLMLYSAPSGLNLYIMTSTFVGVIESHYIKKHIREKEEAQNLPIAGDGTTKIKTHRLKKR